MCCSPSKFLLLLRLAQLFDRFAQKYVLLPLKVRSVVHLPCYTAITPRDGSVSLIYWKREAHYGRKQLCGKDHFPRLRQLRGTYRELFATRKEAEEFCVLTDYAMKLNYGAEQQLVTTEIVAL